MKAALQRLGNSRGLIIPKPILAQLGLEREVEMVVERDALVIRRPQVHAREGWAEAARRLSAAGDALEWPEFSNQADAEWDW
ncbi:MAG: AbrB/MazE/SpoVT family DNA-binding domain-containing protein [Vulcanimicrobiaceae bacterium]